MSNPWMSNHYPDYKDELHFSALGSTFKRLGIVDAMWMNVLNNDSGCGDPECCGTDYEECYVYVGEETHEIYYREWY